VSTRVIFMVGPKGAIPDYLDGQRQSGT
jgi:hypothetical protein